MNKIIIFPQRVKITTTFINLRQHQHSGTCPKIKLLRKGLHRPSKKSVTVIFNLHTINGTIPLSISHVIMSQRNCQMLIEYRIPIFWAGVAPRSAEYFKHVRCSRWKIKQNCPLFNMYLLIKFQIGRFLLDSRLRRWIRQQFISLRDTNRVTQ